MKKLYIILYILISFCSYAQIGIGTSNPQGILHVDGAKDNLVSGVPTSGQQINDFIITASGNVGIGNTAPQRKLDADAGAQSLRIQNLIRQVPADHDILIRSEASGDVTTAKYSYSINSASIAAGAAGTVTIPSTINIPAGMLIVRSGNACGRTMISTYMYSDMSLGYLSAVARDKVGVVTSSAGGAGTSSGWGVKFANVLGCADGGGATQFDYTIVKTGGSTYTITNNGNIARTYTLTVFRL
ncbi:hypothetical protein [Chryseobacterium vrystaatense]|uniref:Uncharacterized protein n=1 Tax=Chryseobacterium vrystaatense TaxID=307480 RepID=A0ABR4UHI0_9FLAO|nr:hypothetical protein [Chryseobacterium vrystaatense]KFF23999.1 hypothetical protein IW16_21700 [Chryseobacterium vrystaatense]